MTKRRSVTEQARSLAEFLPGGQLFGAKNLSGTNLQKLLQGLAQELYISDGYIRDFTQEIVPDETVEFIAEWESAVGIPDDCIPIADTLDQRRINILAKLASLGVQTVSDFQNLAAIFGVTVDVEPITETSAFPLELPFTLISTETEARFTILVNFYVTTPNKFPLTFPVQFGDEIISTVDCLFRKLKPANCNMIFREV